MGKLNYSVDGKMTLWTRNLHFLFPSRVWLVLTILVLYILDVSSQNMYPMMDWMSTAGRNSITCAFAPHRVSMAYTGATFRFRRSSDNVELDFFADSVGNLGTALGGTGTSLSSWLSGASAFVTIWYDQSGGGRHATQTTTTLQPTYSLANENVQFDSSGDFMNVPLTCVGNGDLPYSSVSRHGFIGTNGAVYGFGSGTQGTSVVLRKFTPTSYRVDFHNNFADFNGYANDSVVTVTYTVATKTSRVFCNNVEQTSQTSAGRVGLSGTSYLGNWGSVANSALKGTLHFLFMSNIVLSTSDRRTLEGYGSVMPTLTPSAAPSRLPTVSPTVVPTVIPTQCPTRIPTVVPSRIPTVIPTVTPTVIPTQCPTRIPTVVPTQLPTATPTTGFPTVTPTAIPTQVPTVTPTVAPTRIPTVIPTAIPSIIPTQLPTVIPTQLPTVTPTVTPTQLPTAIPTVFPTAIPTRFPTVIPTVSPTQLPSVIPTFTPTIPPSILPSVLPSQNPTRVPTGQPSCQPSSQPSTQPSRQPSSQPSSQPTSQPSRQPSSQPSVQPSMQPSGQPSRQPSSQPTSQPSTQPSVQPSMQPSGQPSRQPSSQPTSQPSTQPSVQPSMQPSGQPSRQPSSQPSAQPTCQPSTQPSVQPSMQPSGQPSCQPSTQPSGHPSSQPTSQPTSQPSCLPSPMPSTQPSTLPSSQPTSQPSGQPSPRPSTQPTSQPTGKPSSQPSMEPSYQPTSQPSSQPSSEPTCQPTVQPSCEPSRQPTSQPSAHPSSLPTSQPTSQPSKTPSAQPSSVPTSHISCQPSSQPSTQPTRQPSCQPSRQPSSQPSSHPSSLPTRQPSCHPSSQPSAHPSCQPTFQPTLQPSCQPSCQPSIRPTTQPSSQPSIKPSVQPSVQPSLQPSCRPSAQPSLQPIAQPSAEPSVAPSFQPSSPPSSQPSRQPSSEPSAQPTSRPTSQPTHQPSCQPSSQPSCQPSANPSILPSGQPSNHPTAQPSCQPSSQPTVEPSIQPSAYPSSRPSSQPSSQPSSLPSGQPSCQPSSLPSAQPSNQPSVEPTMQPSSRPTCQPASLPSSQPTLKPTTQPTEMPSRQPSSQPSCNPTSQPTAQPSQRPSSQSTGRPTSQPSVQPSSQPTVEPTTQPTSQPSGIPTSQPSMLPSIQPIGQPSGWPSSQPTNQPSAIPTAQPTSQPSIQPSRQPSVQPSCRPTIQPTVRPSAQPSAQPTSQPSAIPSQQPSRQPSSQPSMQPSCQPSLQPVARPTSRPSLNRLTPRPSLALLAPLPQNSTTSRNASAAVEVLSSLTSSQGDVSVITESIRVVGQTIESLFSNSSTAILIPLTDEEKAAGKEVPSINLAAEAAGNSSVYVAVALIDSSLWSTANSSSTTPKVGQLQTGIVALSITGANVSHVDISFPALVGQNETVAAINFTVSCPPKFAIKKAFLCNDTGHVEVVQCNGIEGTLHGQCPLLQATCAALDLTSMTASLQNMCQTIQSNSSNTEPGAVGGGITCRCGLSTDTTTGSSTIAAGVVNSLVGADLSNAFEASSAFGDGSAATKAATLIGLFCALWGATVLLTMYFTWKKKDGKIADIKNVAKVQVGSGSGVSNVDSSSITFSKLIYSRFVVCLLGMADKVADDTSLLSSQQQSLLNYIDSLFPAVFVSKSALTGVLHEVYEKHPYINLLFRLHKSRTPIIEVVKIVTLQTFLLFMLALLYDINYPTDDGSCALNMNEKDCLRRKYEFEPTVSYCRWQPLVYGADVEETPGTFTFDDIVSSVGLSECVFVDPSFSFTMLMYVSMMISFGQSLFLEPLEYLLQLLRSPTMTDAVKAQVDGRYSEAKALESRRYVVQSNSIAEYDIDGRLRKPVSRKISTRQESGGKATFTEVGIHHARRVPRRDKRRGHVDESIWVRQPSPYSAVVNEDEAWQNSSAAALMSEELRATASHRLLLHGKKALSRSSPKGFEELEVAIQAQRYALRKARMRTQAAKFDTAWCLDHATGQFSTVHIEAHSQRSSLCLPCRQGVRVDVVAERTYNLGISSQSTSSNSSILDIRDVIHEDLQKVRQESVELSKVLSKQTSSERGFEMLLQFVQDVLGRKSAAARIYATKIDLEYSKSEYVSFSVKIGIALFLICLNGFFFYFTLLRGISKGSAWQRSYITAWILQLILDACFFETMECIWFEYFIPSLAKDEVQRAKRVLQDVAQQLVESMRIYEDRRVAANNLHSSQQVTAKDRWKSLRTFVLAHRALSTFKQRKRKRNKKSKASSVPEQVYILNSPRYFFVSHQLAVQFPDLVESRLIRLFRSHLPGQIAVDWHKQLKKWKREQLSRSLRLQSSQMKMGNSPQHLEEGVANDLSEEAIEDEEDEDDHDPEVLQRRKWQNMKGIRYWLYMPKYYFVFLVIQIVINVSLPLQRFIIRVLEPVFFSGLVLCVLLLQSSPIYLGIACVGATIWLAKMLYDRIQTARAARVIRAEVDEEHDDDVGLAGHSGDVAPRALGAAVKESKSKCDNNSEEDRSLKFLFSSSEDSLGTHDSGSSSLYGDLHFASTSDHGLKRTPETSDAEEDFDGSPYSMLDVHHQSRWAQALDMGNRPPDLMDNGGNSDWDEEEDQYEIQIENYFMDQDESRSRMGSWESSALPSVFASLSEEEKDEGKEACALDAIKIANSVVRGDDDDENQAICGTRSRMDSWESSVMPSVFLSASEDESDEDKAPEAPATILKSSDIFKESGDEEHAAGGARGRFDSCEGSAMEDGDAATGASNSNAKSARSTEEPVPAAGREEEGEEKEHFAGLETRSRVDSYESTALPSLFNSISSDEEDEASTVMDDEAVDDISDDDRDDHSVGELRSRVDSYGSSALPSLFGSLSDEEGRGSAIRRNSIEADDRSSKCGSRSRIDSWESFALPSLFNSSSEEGELEDQASSPYHPDNHQFT